MHLARVSSINPGQVPFPFDDPATDDDGVDVAGMSAQHYRTDRVGHGRQVEGAASDANDIGLLAWGQTADASAETASFRPVDRREFEHIPRTFRTGVSSSSSRLFAKWRSPPRQKRI